MPEEDPLVVAAKIARDAKDKPDKHIYTYQRTGAWGKSMTRASKAQLMNARTTRYTIFGPLVGIILIAIFLIGPSIGTILGIIGTMNPIIWIIGVLVLIWLWRRFV